MVVYYRIISVTDHTNRLKENYMINLTDAEKASDKTQISYEKALNKLEKGGISLPTWLRAFTENPQLKSTQWWWLGIPLKIRNKTRIHSCHLQSTLYWSSS